jgi:glycosyltransferase involved in cell wall biosynthesis
VIGPNVAFIYWGRRGFSRFTLEAMHAASKIGLGTYFSISTSNELYPEFRQFGDTIFPIDTFSSAPGAVLKALDVLYIRRKLRNWLAERQVGLVITLMPQVWNPLISGTLRRAGMHYAVVIHDAKPHPGDPTGLACPWLLTDAKIADTVVTLSHFVKNELVKQGSVPAERIKTAFMPDIAFPREQPHLSTKPRRHRNGRPLRILFFGRIMQYKGLQLFTDAMEILTAQGVPVEICVCGEGQIGSASPRLSNLGATIINRWLTDAEVGELLASNDVVVLTHIEASQSGVISAALGAGLPVVTTPAGGLAEQIQPRGVGIVAERIDAKAVAESVRALAVDHALYDSIVNRIERSATTFSMAQFVEDLVAIVDRSRSSRPHRAAVAALDGLSYLA